MFYPMTCINYEFIHQVPDFSEPFSSIVEMAVSQNNRHVALFASNGILWIGSADLKKRYCEFDTKCPSQPKQLVW
jgi:Vps16, N-terminal region.